MTYDERGSQRFLTDATGTVIYETNYDAWGRERNPNDWTYTSNPTTPPEWLIRGFTGHEHLKEFALINMNGRVYDPVIGRVLSPDNFVQNPYGTQYYNRFSYVLNNPLIYNDPEGQFLGTLFTATWDFLGTVFTKGAIDPWNTGANRREAWREFDPTAYWSKTNKAWRIDKGSIKTDPNRTFGGRAWELTSRFTWQLPQTAVGYIYTHGRNVAGRVESVEYFHGATIAVKYSGQGTYAGASVTIGNYINLANVADDPEAHIGIGPGSYTTMHEYGHYFQSQASGPLYLFKYGIPSAGGADWTELDANFRAAEYFNGKNSFQWDPNYYSNIGEPWYQVYSELPQNKTNPKWWEYGILAGAIGTGFLYVPAALGVAGGYVIGGIIVTTLTLKRGR